MSDSFPLASALAQLPFLTADLPGIGGQIKQEPADFVVEERPLFPASQTGQFLYLWVEKTGLSAEQLTSHLARELQFPHQEISQAGLKDRHAITRQWVCVPDRCLPRAEAFQHSQIRILRIDRHYHKLRAGQLLGNHFQIRIRNVAADSLALAEPIAARLRQQGMLNYFGDQRFGRDAETLALGMKLLRGQAKPGDIPYARRKFLLRLALSAAQSMLFNEMLRRRVQAGTSSRVQAGDLLQKTGSGGLFVAEDPAVEQPRWDAGEVSISGPMFGPKMLAPRGLIAEQEAAVLSEFELQPSDFERYPQLTSGTRRPYTVRQSELKLRPVGADLELDFELPAGSYATVLLREFTKTEL